MYLKKSELKKISQELLAEFKGVLSWKWDDRFDSFLAEFPAESKDEISAILERHLSRKWDKKTIRQAPDSLREDAGMFGDLRAEQLLFTTDPEGNLLIMAAWWPWGDGEVISVRIASPDPHAEEDTDEGSGFFAKLKGLFS